MEPSAISNLLVCFVIDEAGTSATECLFDKDLNFLNKVAECTKQKLHAADVHLIMVGTGLEQVTQDVESTLPYQKIRMLQWQIDNFGNICREDQYEMVEKYPVLQKLITNARCAFYLTKALKYHQVWDGENSEFGFVNALVHYVASRYKGTNALAGVTIKSKMQMIAGIVLRVLHESIAQSNNDDKVAFHDFDKYQDISVNLQACLGFLDCNLDVQNKKFKLYDENVMYSYSISPALISLLAVFLGDSGELGWDKERLETIVAMSELVGKLRQEDLGSHPTACRIVYSPSELPGTGHKAMNYFCTNSWNVVFNASNGNYCDLYLSVKKTLQLVQVKFSTNGSEVKLYLMDELDKNGLIKRDNSNNSQSSDEQERSQKFLWTLYQH